MLFEIAGKVIQAGVAQGLCDVGKCAVIAFEHFFCFLNPKLLCICEGEIPITAVNSFRK